MKKGSTNNGHMHHHPKRQKFSAEKLQVYAFWTGLLSTVVSVIHVVIIATSK